MNKKDFFFGVSLYGDSFSLEEIRPNYIKSNISGKIDLPDNTYDLITAFSVLHHILNVSFVLSELFRVLNYNGYLLIREPIHSMGNWNNQRPGLTKMKEEFLKIIYGIIAIIRLINFKEFVLNIFML